MLCLFDYDIICHCSILTLCIRLLYLCKRLLFLCEVRMLCLFDYDIICHCSILIICLRILYLCLRILFLCEVRTLGLFDYDFGSCYPPKIGSNTSITIVYPAQLMLPDDHGSLVVTSISLQSHAHMVILSLWVMA